MPDGFDLTIPPQRRFSGGEKNFTLRVAQVMQKLFNKLRETRIDLRAAVARIEEHADAMELVRSQSAELAELRREIEANQATGTQLSARLVKVEERPNPPRYRGAHKENVSYFAGDVVTAGGENWRCVVAHTSSAPGTTQALAVTAAGPSGSIESRLSKLEAQLAAMGGEG